MKVKQYDNEEAWLEDRLGRITGTRVKDICPSIPKDEIVKELAAREILFKKTAKKEELEALLPPGAKASIISKMDKKIGYYEILAERVAIPPTDENAMDRGIRLESLAIERFIKETGIKVSNELVMWHRDDDDNIAVSPDGTVTGNKIAVECKCLSSARHIQAWLTQQIPEEYQKQKLQYFIVNDELEELYFAFLDPRMPKDFFIIKITRAEVQAEVDEYLELERMLLAELAEDEKKLTF